MSFQITNGRFHAESASGVPLSGGRLYTYVSGTTTFKATYSDGGLINPNAYASDGVGGLYIALDARGEAQVWLGSGAYSLTLKDASGVTVWSVDNIVDPAAAGAAFQASLAANSGSSLIGFLQNGTGAQARTVQDRLLDSVSVKDFGADPTGALDATAAIQNAILQAAQQYANNNWFFNVGYTVPRVVEFPSGVYKVTGKILLPSGVILRGNNSTLVGTGFSNSDNICIESAYFNAGVLTSNIGTPAESQRLQFSRVEGLKFIDFKVALNLYDVVDGCRVTDCAFADCGQAIIADRCFYAQFTNLFYRNVSEASALPAFDFRHFVNVEHIESVFITGRILGMKFSGGVNGLTLRNCSVESGTTGIVFTDNINPMNIDSCYFEGLGGTALDFTAGGGTNAITIDNNWFFGCGTAIAGANMLGACRIGRGNYFTGGTTNAVVITDNVSTIKVELPTVRIASNAGSLRPALPAGYSFGAAVQVDQPVQIYDADSGNTTVQGNYGALTTLPFSGKQGFQSGKIPFCDTSTTGTVTMTGFIDTKIAYDIYVMAIYALTITDNNGSYAMAGRTYGSTVMADVTGGKTLTASNNGGFLRLTITGLSHPSGVMGAEGIVRMV